MPTVDLVIPDRPSTTFRAQQVSAMFDLPPGERPALTWKGDLPLDARPWNVGLIVGPSGSGKSTVMRQLWGEMPKLSWSAPSVVDDIPRTVGIEALSSAFSAVGFNTIPAWLRPFSVLSNGEQFRVDLARRLLELPDPIVVDEFTSVVDRQVAQIGSHAVQKLVRKQGRRLVAVTCHYDVIDWLQPDWVLEPATMTFQWRSVQPRPRIEVEARRCRYDTWRLFAPYHYLTADLNTAARCFALYSEGHPVAFAGVLHTPHPSVKDLHRFSRVVTLPDWQGLGLVFVLGDMIASAYAALGKRFRSYPAHPALIQAMGRSPLWKLVKAPDLRARSKSASGLSAREDGRVVQGGRPCAVYEYQGPLMPYDEAEAFIGRSS